MSAQANKELIERFYGAFDRKDGHAMAECYASDVHFSDPAFGDLHGPRAEAMWQMLLDAPGDLAVELLEHDADEKTGSAHWRATYVFSQTGRPVVNDVRARFTFRDGLIAEHHDQFDFHRWARQALGAPGLLLGWTPFMRNAVRRKANARLEEHTGVAAQRRY